MSQAYVMYGYGIVKVEEIIKEELLQEECIFDLVDKIEQKENLPEVFHTYGEDIGDVIGVPLNLPYEKQYFKDSKECDQYIYDAIKHLLKEEIKIEDIEFEIYEDYGIE